MMKKQIAIVVGAAVAALSLGLVGCTTPKQNPQNALNLSEPSYTSGEPDWVPASAPHQLRSIHFAWASAEINPVWNKELNALATGLKSHPKGMVTIIGFTDSTGSPHANRNLGRERANAVANYLKAQGVSPTQIHVISAGQRHPIANNADAVGQYMNRRVDLIVSGRS